ncbi:unnamed protein product [Adineta steineri]|uniref:Uncharacterized protein n=1 Tax=Adineta steineri TaxID=433720 RepID=A0A815WTR4_9BILA|nr:unnamed protein product [Adineta steineri]CAF1553554.1 unnamed protein product [Adineta steineri]
MASSITKPINAAEIFCRSNAYPRCGKCTDWRYDGDFKHDIVRYERRESKDINDEKRWHRHPNATCFRHGTQHFHHTIFFVLVLLFISVNAVVSKHICCIFGVYPLPLIMPET